MSQARIYELQYTEFTLILRKSVDTRKKIDKAEKAAWMKYVNKHNVPEAAMEVKGKSGKARTPITFCIERRGCPHFYTI